MYKYAFFDVDATIYNGWSNNDLIYFLVKKKYIDKTFTERIEEYVDAYRRGIDDYETSARKVCLLMVSVFQGKTVEEVSQWGREFLENSNKIFPWVKPLMELLDRNGFKTYLISASVSPMVKILADYLQTDRYYATEISIDDAVYSDKIESILNYDEKQKLVHRIIGHLPERSLTLGIGDSTGDVAMLSVVDKAFVIHPHQEEMILLAKRNNWKLTTDDSITRDITQIISLLPSD